MKKLRVAWVVFGLLLVSCGPQSPAIFGDESLIVSTPRYQANKLFYLDGAITERPGGSIRYSHMQDPLLLATGEAVQTDAVENGDPVSIIVNRVSLPESLTADGGPETRDIAVLLDFAGQAGEAESAIVVWYQRGVPANEPLSFRDLLVYNQDSWDNRVAPYFRMRIVDVSTERNVRTRELLNQVSNFSGTLGQIFAGPAAGPVIELAGRAAQLVLANDDNELLIDFTFNLYSPAQISEAGGMPLGVFRRGGLMVSALPDGQDRNYWANEFWFDHLTSQIWRKSDDKSTGAEQPETTVASSENTRTIGGSPTNLLTTATSGSQTIPDLLSLVDSPFLLATVVTSEAVVPAVVSRRSKIITETLSSSAIIRENIGEVIKDAESLVASLELMRARESFARNPTISGFKNFVGEVSGNAELQGPEKFWALSVMRNTVGVRRATADEYLHWLTECDMVQLDAETRQFNLDEPGVPANCKS